MTEEMDSKFWNAEYVENPERAGIEDRILEDEVEGLPPGTALDLGCGTGKNILKLAEQGWSVTGVDWAERAVEIARESAEDMNADAKFIVADITTWKPDRTYDLVFSSYSLPTGEDRRNVLSTAAAALTGGGTLLIAEWDRSMCAAWGFAEGDLLSPEEIAEMLPGLHIEKMEVRCFEGLFTDEDQRSQYGDRVNVAFVRGRKPLISGK